MPAFSPHPAHPNRPLLTLQASLRAEVKRLHDLLHSAHFAKKQWRERALQVGRVGCVAALARILRPKGRFKPRAVAWTGLFQANRLWSSCVPPSAGRGAVCAAANRPAPSHLTPTPLRLSLPSQVEAQFVQLRSLIQDSLSQTAHELQQAASPPPPLNANPRIRASEEARPLFIIHYNYHRCIV